MGAKTWMLVYADSDARDALGAGGQLDREATQQLAERLFPNERLEPSGEGDLSRTCPRDRELCVGCFPGVSVVAAKEFARDRPSRLAPHFLTAGAGRVVTLVAMHSVVDWFAYARWVNGALVRSLSVSPDSGVIENIGDPMPFEQPFWSGAHPVDTDGGAPYPLPFHPLDLGDAALGALFGYELEGQADASVVDLPFDPERIPLLRYRRSRRWRWMFWQRRSAKRS